MKEIVRETVLGKVTYFFAGCLICRWYCTFVSNFRGLQKLTTACEQYGRLWDL